MTDDAVTAHIPYGSILLFHKSFLTEYGSCDNTQAADAEQDDPEMHHAIVAGLRVVRVGRKTYVVLTYVALAVAVFVLVRCCVGLVSASTLIPVVVLVRLPSFTPVTSPVVSFTVTTALLSDLNETFLFVASAGLTV